ncbi:MAG: sugar ABC transporter permease, partial [Actinomycetota bacterium]|nr:sugar ABC transporter permease [Actinomycetota bacterium]
MSITTTPEALVPAEQQAAKKRRWFRRGPKPARDRINKREAIAGYLFITPWIIGFLVFTAGAMIYSLYISFSNYNLATNS